MPEPSETTIENPADFAEISSDIYDVDGDADDLDKPIVGTIEGSTIPERDIDRLENTFRGVQRGQEIELELGTGEVQVTRRGKVVGKRGVRCDRVGYLDWRFTIEIVLPLDADDGVSTRLYRIGIGDGRYEPWSVLSYSYNTDLEMIDEKSEIAHGWAISATINP
jgi:hypothetical protein